MTRPDGPGAERRDACGPVALVLAVTVLASSLPAAAQDDEDPVMALVDNRASPDAPPGAAGPGTHLTLAAEGESFTFVVPSSCAAWLVGEEIVMACAKAAWPKLNGRVTLTFGKRQGHVPLERADPEWSGLPPPIGQYHLQARKSLRVGDHLGNVEAYCDNAWRYCTEMRVDGALYGSHTILRFAARTWDGWTARGLGDVIAAGSMISSLDSAGKGPEPGGPSPEPSRFRTGNVTP